MTFINVVAHAWEVKYGVLATFASTSAEFRTTDDTYRNYQLLAGAAAAFDEANRLKALGDNVTLTLDVQRSGGSATPASMVANGAAGFLFPDAATVDAVLAEAIARDVPVLGGDAGADDPAKLYTYATAGRAAVNYRFSYPLEFRSMVNYALNSHIRCRRIGVLASNGIKATAIAGQLQSILTGLGVAFQAVAFDPATVAGGDYSVVGSFYTDATRVPQCFFMLADQTLVDGFIVEFQKSQTSAAQQADTYYFVPSSGYHPRLAAAIPATANLYSPQQVPSAADTVGFEVVRRYRAAAAALSSGGGLAAYTNAVGTIAGPDRYGLEGYIVGRMVVEVLSRDPLLASAANASSRGPRFLNTLYRSKYLSVDDFELGPYGDGCKTLAAARSGLPCNCSAGAKLLVMNKVDTTSDALREVAIDASIRENPALNSTYVPAASCGLYGAISVPVTFLQAQDYDLFAGPSSEAKHRQTFFRAVAFLLFDMLNRGFPSKTFVLVSPYLSASQAAFEPQAVYQQSRNTPLAWISPSYNRSIMNQGSLSLPIVHSDLITGIRLEDPPLSEWRQDEVFLSPTWAEYLHGMASFAIEEKKLNSLGLIGPEAHLALAEKSLNTFSATAAFKVTATTASELQTALEAQIGAATSAAGSVMVVATDLSMTQAAFDYASARPDVTLYLVADEWDVERVMLVGDATRFSGARKAGFALAQHNIFFASQMPAFWDPTERGSSIAGDFWRSVGGFSGYHLPDVVYFMKTYRLVLLLFTAASGLTNSATSPSFFAEFYNRGTLTLFDESFGEFTSTTCSADIISRNAAARSCQCSKGPRAIYTLSMKDWVDTTGKAGLHTNYKFSLPSTQCGVEYKELPPPPLAAWVMYTIYGAGGLAVIIIIVVVVLLSRKKTRDTSLAPKDGKKPFAVAFTDIQSSTNLWARAPQAMGPAVETHHEIIRKIIPKRKGYEVKTVGDAFMVAFSDAKNAVQFAADVQDAFHEYPWDPIIDEVYNDLEAEKREAYAQDHPGEEMPLASGGPKHAWGGVRVRIGINYGFGDIKLDEVSLGYDYYGTIVNTAARIEAAGHGGQVVISKSVLEAVAGEGAEELGINGMSTKYQGSALLRGLDEPLHLYQVIPDSLKEREFGPLRLDVDQGDDDDDDDLGTGDGTKSMASSASAVQGVVPPEVSAEKFARRWKRNEGTRWAAAMRLTLSNYACLKALLSISQPKERNNMLATWAEKWRVDLSKSRKASEEELYQHHIMQVVVKMTPAAEAIALEASKASGGWVAGEDMDLDDNTSLQGSTSMGHVPRRTSGSTSPQRGLTPANGGLNPSPGDKYKQSLMSPALQDALDPN